MMQHLTTQQENSKISVALLYFFITDSNCERTALPKERLVTAR
jgi:hypothetical protein